jgi:methyl-accepting chemotaxis protein
MVRVLLPIGALLVVLVAGSVAGVALKDSAAARAAFERQGQADRRHRRPRHGGRDLEPGCISLAKASLAALAVDPDYVGSELSDDQGTAFASDGAKQAGPVR